MKERKQRAIIHQLLKLVAPGTLLRDGIDNVLRAKTGGLIVLGYNHEMTSIVDGGFFINCAFSPSNLYELAKMDGAIILNEDGSRILYANTQLNPNNAIESNETGIRHRTAERVAKQTGNLVISISQRRHVITIYQGENRYSLKEIGAMLAKANQAIQTLEKYKTVLEQSIANLSALEFEQLVSINDVVQVIDRIHMVLKIEEEIIGYVNELGSEGRLITMQLNELVFNVEKEALLLIKDYMKNKQREPKEILQEVMRFSSDDLVEEQLIVRALGYTKLEEFELAPRGYRILNKIPRLPTAVIENLIDAYGTLNAMAIASIEELDEVDGIGTVRAFLIKNGLKRIQEQLFNDRYI